MYACRNVDMLETEGSLAPVVSYIMNISFAWCRVQTYQYRRAKSRLLPLGSIRADEVGASALALSRAVLLCSGVFSTLLIIGFGRPGQLLNAVFIRNGEGFWIILSFALFAVYRCTELSEDFTERPVHHNPRQVATGQRL